MDDEKEKDLSPTKGLTLALTSGVLAAIAGTFGKLAMTQNETVWFCEYLSSKYLNFSDENAYSSCSHFSMYFRASAFISMILMNGIMWTTFVKALRYCKTSLEATVTNTAANFFFSALVGQLIFGESVGILWWIGTLLIIFGLALMNYTGKGGNLRILTSSKKRKMR